MCVTDLQKIDQFLDRGVENWFPSKEFIRARLLEGKQLSMYLGIDPTGPTLHLGHMIPLRKLREFQDLGHKVILLIGDFTGMIGDPTDKSATRKQLTRKEVLQNAKLYKSQASKILRFSGPNKAELKYNSKWLAKMSFANVIELAAHFTVQQMLEREMFQRRLRWDIHCKYCGFIRRSPIQFASLQNFETATISGSYQCPSCKKLSPLDKHYIQISEEAAPVYMHEILYPLMQGYDSVAMRVDGEIGGNDQTFNMLAGRTLMKEISHKEKFVFAMKLLVDSEGKKMGKTEGNMITMADSSDQMFGKIMSWTDGMIRNGFELLTDTPLGYVDDWLKEQNPRDVKMSLAQEVVRSFFGKEPKEKDRIAEEAQKNFIAMFQKHEVPDDVQEMIFDAKNLLEVLVAAKFVTSKSEARRVIMEDGVKVDGAVEKDWDVIVPPGALVQKGKRHFVRIVK